MEEPIVDGPTVDSPSQEDADLAVIAPTRQTALAGGVGIGVGAFTTLLAVQTSSVWRMEGLALVATLLLFVFGPGAIFLGWNLRKVRGWAALGAAVLSGVASLAIALWSVYALLSGFLSLLSFAMIPGHAIVCVLAWGRVRPTRVADSARARLAAQGLDGGL
jgi:hypothetical protein